MERKENAPRLRHDRHGLDAIRFAFLTSLCSLFRCLLDLQTLVEAVISCHKTQLAHHFGLLDFPFAPNLWNKCPTCQLGPLGSFGHMDFALVEPSKIEDGFSSEWPDSLWTLLVTRASLLVAPGLTSNKKLLGAKGIATRSKDATRGSWPYY